MTASWILLFRLDPAVPAALLDAYWLMVDSPARSLCGRCRPEQEKGSAAKVQQRRLFSNERMSGRWRVARSVILAFVAGSVLAAVWATAVAEG
ncbi:hypothetical protein [Streptomyces sp. NPDC058644]|uniref:hypothetical protein n=1 Tax=unclassified Streptomyces TaxID=2593676 RepID=UPI00365E473F